MVTKQQQLKVMQKHLAGLPKESIHYNIVKDAVERMQREIAELSHIMTSHNAPGREQM
jgi:hypothetical protein